jgi:hypothetical protein
VRRPVAAFDGATCRAAPPAGAGGGGAFCFSFHFSRLRRGDKSPRQKRWQATALHIKPPCVYIFDRELAWAIRRRRRAKNLGTGTAARLHGRCFIPPSANRARQTNPQPTPPSYSSYKNPFRVTSSAVHAET